MCVCVYETPTGAVALVYLSLRPVNTIAASREPPGVFWSGGGGPEAAFRADFLFPSLLISPFISSSQAWRSARFQGRGCSRSGTGWVSFAVAPPPRACGCLRRYPAARPVVQQWRAVIRRYQTRKHKGTKAGPVRPLRSCRRLIFLFNGMRSDRFVLR